VPLKKQQTHRQTLLVYSIFKEKKIFNVRGRSCRCRRLGVRGAHVRSGVCILKLLTAPKKYLKQPLVFLYFSFAVAIMIVCFLTKINSLCD